MPAARRTRQRAVGGIVGAAAQTRIPGARVAAGAAKTVAENTGAIVFNVGRCATGGVAVRAAVRAEQVDQILHLVDLVHRVQRLAVAASATAGLVASLIGLGECPARSAACRGALGWQKRKREKKNQELELRDPSSAVPHAYGGG